MKQDSAERVDRGFLDAVRGMRARPGRVADDTPLHPDTQLTARLALALFDSQLCSRHLDFAGRWLRGRGLGYYTIGSSGHEGNAVVAAASRITDPALLHYRSGAFFVQRARMCPEQFTIDQALTDVLLGMVASRDEPIAGGRHKVFGSAPLAIWPQTSTIASHLPKAVGMAFALHRKHRLGIAPDTAGGCQHPPADAIVVCSFGDASINHSTAVGAINAACRSAHQHLPVPILFVCEDNGFGISVRTPRGYIADIYGNRSELRYFHGDGTDLASAFDAAQAAVAYVRGERRPALLHLDTVRLMGHAGSDVEMVYRSQAEIQADDARDPLRASARLLIEAGLLSPDEILARYEATQVRVRELSSAAARRPRLRDAADVMAPLAPRDDDAIAAEVARETCAEARAAMWGDRLPEHDGPAPLSAHINRALGDLAAKYPQIVMFGEDVGKKGGVYGVTRGLQARVGMARVFDTILDEQSILGLAIGAGQLDMLPIAEIQYLAYLHNALDQLRGEAATLSFFSRAQLGNPMVVRIASYAYQKGFGGHFHNDHAVAALREIPGLIIASPARGGDAAAMLRTCVAAARVHRAVSVMLEPIARYSTRDLHEPDDGAFATAYQPDGEHVPLGAARTYGDGRDLLIVTFANGVYMSLRAARRLAEHGVQCRVLDLRWLAPLPVDDLLREASVTGKVLIVDETRRSGGVSEGVIAALIDRGFSGTIRRVAAHDSFVPLGEAAHHVLVSEPDIERAARAMV